MLNASQARNPLHPETHLLRARGCLLGQLAGDALGGLVEFSSPAEIRKNYPKGVRDLQDGGTWNTLAGQPTDDSEMALSLARMLVKEKKYTPEKAMEAYLCWYHSKPFDIGATTIAGLSGTPNQDSQANGALMRISPLGIFGAGHDLKSVARWAMKDAALTHPHPVCQTANALFACAISYAIKSGCSPKALFDRIEVWAADLNAPAPLKLAIENSQTAPPADYLRQKGWVITAFHNALYQLLHAPNLEEALVDTIMRGGDTDTNAAICGALLGAVYSESAVPARWINSLRNCRPSKDNPRALRPRPECYWPVDAEVLAEKLLISQQLSPE